MELRDPRITITLAMKAKFQKELADKALWRNKVSQGVVVTVNKINATFSIKAKGLLVSVFKRTLGAIGLATTVARVRSILIFVNRSKSIHSTQGMKGLVNYLKANTVLLQQALGGFKLYDCTELKSRPSRTKAGLPRLILAQDRALIRAGNTKVMRFYLTLFNLYRVLEFPGTLKLKTILDPFKGNMADPLYKRVVSYIPVFVGLLNKRARDAKVRDLTSRGIEPTPIIKSAPGTAGGQVSTNPFVLVNAAVNLRQRGLAGCVEYFIKYYEKGTKVPYPGLMAVFQGAAHLPMDLIPSLGGYVGRLGFKDEPAGKVRVFAMVDAWTQWVLEPFHSYLFDILRTIEQDGTFDQLKPVKERASKAQSAYSLDLSAATDRLPISIQIELFATLVSREFATQWAMLLVGRHYVAITNKYGGLNQALLYAVGQPMGALSSWASLAVTHHFMVQCAAWEAGVVPVGVWFTDYAVLGDDLVIFNQKVKVHYLRIIEILGVECGIAKSLLSSKGTCIEFAKRTIYKGEDISPIPLKEFLMANLTLAEAISFARKYSLTFPELLKALGYGYRVLGSVNKHVGKLNSRVRALLFAYHIPVNEDQATEMLFRGNPLISQAQLAEVVQAFKDLLTQKYRIQIEKRLKSIADAPTAIKAAGADALQRLVQRMYLVGFLNAYLQKVLPGEGAGLPATYDPEATTETGFKITPEYADETDGLLSKATVPSILREIEGVESSKYRAPVLITVPPQVFNRVETHVRDWTLVIERVAKLVIAPTLAKFRTGSQEAIKAIGNIRWAKPVWDPSIMQYRAEIYAVYAKALVALREISAAGTKVQLEREINKVQHFSMDPVQMRFWRDFTTCILMALKKGQGKDTTK